MLLLQDNPPTQLLQNYFIISPPIHLPPHPLSPTQSTFCFSPSPILLHPFTCTHQPATIHLLLFTCSRSPTTTDIFPPSCSFPPATTPLLPSTCSTNFLWSWNPVSVCGSRTFCFPHLLSTYHALEQFWVQFLVPVYFKQSPHASWYCATWFSPVCCDLMICGTVSLMPARCVKSWCDCCHTSNWQIDHHILHLMQFDFISRTGSS